MKENLIFPHGFRGCFISFVIILAAISAMAISTTYQYPKHPFCSGMLGAGFPALFICDDWGGGSPSNSWGKITFIDVPNGGIRPVGFLIDFLFYALLMWAVLLLVGRIFQRRISQKDLWWAALVSFTFIAGFLCASLMFLSSSLYLGDDYYRTSPTPILPSSTPPGTMPVVETPVSTPAP
ncbi:MAG TPA: hypothetical protein VK897_01650 [Anaerolineales bacterium]|nr:hypothetical protein [Anaerolineales bacterium]